MRFLVKLFSYFRWIFFTLASSIFSEIFQKKSVKANVHKSAFFYERVFRFFLIQFITRKILIYVLHRIFRFWLLVLKELHKNVIKAKRRKAEHRFVDKVFIYDLTKFQEDLINAAVVGAHARLYSQSSIKIPGTK